MPPANLQIKMKKLYGKLGGRKKKNNRLQTLSENNLPSVTSEEKESRDVPPTTSTLTTPPSSTISTPSNATFTSNVLKSSNLWSAKKRRRRNDDIDATYSDPSSSPSNCMIDIDFLQEILRFVRCKSCGGETNSTVKVLCFSTMVSADCTRCGKVVFSNKQKEMTKIK